VADIKKFGLAGKKTAVVSTINGDANVPFYKELGNQGIKATDIRLSRSRSAKKISPARTPAVVRSSRCLELLRSIKTPEKREVHQGVADLHKNPKRVTNDPMEAHVIGFDMWVKAVREGEVDRS